MKQVSIKKQDQITNQGSFDSQEEAQAWLDKHIGMGSFGSPRFSKQQVEISPAVLDAEGVEISPAQYEEQEVESDPSGYEIVIEDISAKLEQEKINEESLAYLASTDYIVTKAMERGELLSEEFKAERQAARDRIVK